MDKRLRWFDEGAPTLRQALERLGLADQLPPGRDYYACPCCLRAYPREAITTDLTVEDVPPKSVGGRPLLLTCRQCNNTAGSAFDSHAAMRVKADAFVRGEVTDRPLPMTSYVDGIPLRGTAQWTDDGVQLIGVPEKNDNKVQAKYFKALDEYVQNGSATPNFSFEMHTRFDEARARISWLRAAYLAAFAALGWAFILRAVMDPYRHQIARPETEILPTHVLREPNASAERRRILLVESPDEFRCVAVIIGEHTMFLPSLSRPMTCNEIVESFASNRGKDSQLRVQLNGKRVPWPTRATYFLDQ